MSRSPEPRVEREELKSSKHVQDLIPVDRGSCISPLRFSFVCVKQMGSKREELEFFSPTSSTLGTISWFYYSMCSKNINNEKGSLYRKYFNPKEVS